MREDYSTSLLHLASGRWYLDSAGLAKYTLKSAMYTK
jgi:hypothetical protein